MLSNQEILSASVEYINTTASLIENEEIKKYKSSNPDDLITDDIIKLVRQRMNSELMLRMSNFNAGENVENLDDLNNRIKEWFSSGEEEHLRTMCQSIIKEEVRKMEKSGETEDLSFTEKYLRAVKENSKAGGKTIHLKDL